MELDNLYDQLRVYGDTDYYPFHMPGHKRNPGCMADKFPGVALDITEIDGFDNLHHPEGILREAQERAARLYGVKETYYSVNGSTAALLSAISASVKKGGKILMARNCHKAVYHAVYLRELTPVYVYPQYEEESGLNGGILPRDVDNLLKKNPDTQAVILTSPTYDGVVSNIAAISRLVHDRGIPLLVDEAHGAHLIFSEKFPDSAAALGADLVIHSVHKTLPSLTQTALLHRVTDRVDPERIRRFMGIYQSSSPSYLLMASMDQCICTLAHRGRQLYASYVPMLERTRESLLNCRHIRLADRSYVGHRGIFDMDISKIVLSLAHCKINGHQLHKLFRENYHLEMEMEAEGYVLALSSVGDTAQGLRRLKEAVLEIDSQMEPGQKKVCGLEDNCPKMVKIPSQAMDAPMERIPMKEAPGRISGEFAYLYPPGIPLMVPGERIPLHLVQDMRRYLEQGLELQGLSDHSVQTVCVLK